MDGTVRVWQLEVRFGGCVVSWGWPTVVCECVALEHCWLLTGSRIHAPADRYARPAAYSVQGEGRPGLPVSVLVGHGGAASFVDFHPTLPDALLSSSFDGTCRIWRARDAAAPPIVLSVDPARFGMTGHAVTRWLLPRAARAAGGWRDMGCRACMLCMLCTRPLACRPSGTVGQ